MFLFLFPFFLSMKNNIKRLRSLIFDKISLISSDLQPAVEKAETAYAIFKQAQRPHVEQALDAVKKLQERIKNLQNEKK
jgi:hypothetical protein